MSPSNKINMVYFEQLRDFVTKNSNPEDKKKKKNTFHLEFLWLLSNFIAGLKVCVLDYIHLF